LQSLLLPITAIFVQNQTFVDGRKDVLPPSQKIKPTDQTIWFHAASLGNRARPSGNRKIKEEYPLKIIVSFFSIGYEVRKKQCSC
jgi:3-deoxy-D-manno-octulosonic-acid transferase